MTRLLARGSRYLRYSGTAHHGQAVRRDMLGRCTVKSLARMFAECDETPWYLYSPLQKGQTCLLTTRLNYSCKSETVHTTLEVDRWPCPKDVANGSRPARPMQPLRLGSRPVPEIQRWLLLCSTLNLLSRILAFQAYSCPHFSRLSSKGTRGMCSNVASLKPSSEFLIRSLPVQVSMGTLA